MASIAIGSGCVSDSARELLSSGEFQRPGLERLAVDGGDPLVELDDDRLERRKGSLESNFQRPVPVIVGEGEGRRRG